MIKYLFYKVIYRFHRINFYLCSVMYFYQNEKGKQNKLKCLFHNIFDNLKIFNYKYGYYEYLEIPITTRCTLKCLHCSNLIPCYKKPSDYDEKILLKSIKAFLECINKIVYIRVLGGEPFLSKNLNSVLKELKKSDKIGRIEVVTNGTILPVDKTVTSALQDPRIVVCISVYPNVNNEKVVAFLKENNIKYRLDKMDYWMDYGTPTKKNRSEKELIKQFTECNHICKSLVNGEVHICPRSSHGKELGIIKNNEDDYLDLFDKKLSLSEKQKRLNILLKKKYIVACDYCDFATKDSKRIPVAEQISHKKNKES